MECSEREPESPAGGSQRCSHSAEEAPQTPSSCKEKELYYLKVGSGNVLFNDALNTFYLRLYGDGHMVKDHSVSERGNLLSPYGKEGNVFYLTTLSTHFIYGYMVSDIW